MHFDNHKCIKIYKIKLKLLTVNVHYNSINQLNQYCPFMSSLKGTPLRSGRVTHLKRAFQKTCFFLLLTCLGQSSLSWGTLICELKRTFPFYKFHQCNIERNTFWFTSDIAFKLEMCPQERMPPLNVLCFFKRPITPSKISGL